MSKIEIGGRPIERVGHVVNKYSTKAKQMVHTRDMIVDGLPYLEHYIINTSADPEDTVRQIHYNARSNDALFSYGGESTNSVIALSATSGPLIDIAPPLFFLPGGNKNDLSHELHIEDVEKHPIAALFTSVLKEVRPIEFEIQPKRCAPIKRRVAVAYGGVGAGGEVCQALISNRDGSLAKMVGDNQFGRFMLDSMWTLQGLAKSRSFEIIDHNNHDSVTRIAERMYINISRMLGGIVLTSAMVDDLRAVRVEANRRSDYVAKITSLAIGLSEETIVDEINDDFTLKSPAILHIDAEPEQLAAGTRIRTKRSSKPIYVLGKR